MDTEKLDELNSMVKIIEEKNSDLEDILKNIDILSRKEALQEIYLQIVNNNSLIQEVQKKKGLICGETVEKDSGSTHSFIDSIIANIENNLSKKVFFLRDFLDKFDDISENDKNVLLKSLEDMKIEELKNKMKALTEIFNINK